MQGLIRHNSLFLPLSWRSKKRSFAVAARLPCYSSCCSSCRGSWLWPWASWRFERRTLEDGRADGFAVMLWLVIAFKVLKVMEIVLLSLSSLSRFFSHLARTPSPLPWSSLAPPSKGDLADGSLGPTPLFAYPSPPSRYARRRPSVESFRRSCSWVQRFCKRAQ